MPDTQTSTAGTAAPPAVRPRPARRRRRRKPVRGFLTVTHRWTALVLGTALVLITTSGAVLLYRPEIFQATHAGLFASTPTNTPITMAQAFDVAERAAAGFTPQSGYLAHGVYAIHGEDYFGPTVYVDPGTGAVNGVTAGGQNSGVMGFLDNLHECALSCADYPGYVAWLEATPFGGLADAAFAVGDDGQPVPFWRGLADLTVASLLLGVLGLLLLFLAVSGIPLWWPSIKRIAHGFRVRWRGGRFARDYDLHQVAGLISVPFLLMWAITGAGFELPFMQTAWAAVTGSSTFDDESFELASVQTGAPDIGLAAAQQAALRLVGGDAEVVIASLPAADDPESTYSFWLAQDIDPYRYADGPGNIGVSVDRYDAGRAAITYGPPVMDVSQDLWGVWSFPTHAGYVVNGWWRIVWFVFGLAPLLLMVTGISTWLVRRRTRKQRTAARAA